MTSAREEEANWSALLIATLKAMTDEELLARTNCQRTATGRNIGGRMQR